MAKVGGLGDVVGALPKYLTSIGATSVVVVPMHKTNFLVTHEWKVVHKGAFMLYNSTYQFTIIREKYNSCGFELYCVDVHGILDRKRIYGYEDDFFRYLVFQVAVLKWIKSFEQLPDVIHLHDHHTGLMPFMMKYCFVFSRLQKQNNTSS